MARKARKSRHGDLITIVNGQVRVEADELDGTQWVARVTVTRPDTPPEDDQLHGYGDGLTHAVALKRAIDDALRD